MYSNWLNVSAGGTGNNKTNSLVILELMPADSASTMIRPSVESGHNCYLIAGSYFNPQILYAGLNGEVIKSNDGGLNWETNSLVADSTIFTSIVLNPQDPRQMLAGGKDRNNLFVLYKSNDKGLSWKPLTSGTYRNCLARCLISGINTMTGEVINDESIILIGTDGDGIFKYPASISPVNVEIENKSDKYFLYQNYPNPFNPSTKINYVLMENAFVNLDIIGILGNKIKTLIDEYKVKGTRSIILN